MKPHRQRFVRLSVRNAEVRSQNAEIKADPQDFCRSDVISVTDWDWVLYYRLGVSESSVCIRPNRTFDLKVRTKEFALQIIRLFRTLPRTEEARVIGRQILRSGTSIGANYRAACRSRSKAEFISKVSIVLEEADETVFWLELLSQSEISSKTKIEGLLAEANELTSIFVTSLRTSKGLDGRA